jgi:hypothetical protein
MSSVLRGLPVILAVIFSVFAGAQTPAEKLQADRLAVVLKRSAAYCQRLGGAALDFVCMEEVKEHTARFTPETRIYLYDYQFVRKNEETKEKRGLVAVDGKKVQAREADLQAIAFHYENVLFGPVGLLSESWQAYHEYKIVGERGSGPEKTVIIEATPGPVPLEAHCYGRLWVREKDGAVLKIVWDQRSLGNYRDVEEWAKSHGAVAQITSYCEYGIEKNGLRFPSRNYSEQAYITQDGRKKVTAQITVTYKDYKFFTVETEVKY